MVVCTFLWSSSRPGARWRTAPPERDEETPQNPPTPCLWQAPAGTWMWKPRPAIRRSARWRVHWSTESHWFTKPTERKMGPCFINIFFRPKAGCLLETAVPFLFCFVFSGLSKAGWRSRARSRVRCKKRNKNRAVVVGCLKNGSFVLPEILPTACGDRFKTAPLVET